MAEAGDRGESVFAGTFAELTYPAYEEAIARGAVALVPVGVIEQHGPHLPLGTDVYASFRLCRLLVPRLARGGVEALICPPLFWGVNEVTSAFPGSIRVRPEVVAGLVHDVLTSLLDDGFTRVYVVNHHGDRRHNEVLRSVLLDLHAEGRRGVRWIEEARHVERVGGRCDEPIWVAFDEPPEATAVLATELGVHAHDQETALVAHYHPGLVDHDALAGLEPTRLGPADLERWRRGGAHAREVTPRGYFGDPHPGERTWQWAELRADAMAGAVLTTGASG